MAIVDVSPFQKCIGPASHHQTHAKVNTPKTTTRLKNTTSQEEKDDDDTAINKTLFRQSLPLSLQPRHNPRNTLFREFYDAGEIPIAVAHGGGSNAVTWRVDPASLDYHRYLPLFFDGIREIDHPYRLLSVQGAKQLLAVRPEKLRKFCRKSFFRCKTRSKHETRPSWRLRWTFCVTWPRAKNPSDRCSFRIIDNFFRF